MLKICEAVVPPLADKGKLWNPHALPQSLRIGASAKNQRNKIMIKTQLTTLKGFAVLPGINILKMDGDLFIAIVFLKWCYNIDYYKF